MSVIKNISSGKKSYRRPTCRLKSMDEVSALLGNETQDQERKRTADRVLVGNEAPILLVDAYEGELDFIAKAACISAGRLGPLSIVMGGGLVEMKFADERNSASSRAFLLLDLRSRGDREPGLLESVGGIAELGCTIPLVILVSSIEQFESWGANTRHCWQLKGGLSPAELASALRSFLHLCAVFASRSNAKNLRPATEVSSN